MCLEKENLNNNVGSCESQITIFTYRINNLQRHFVIHKKDKHSKRGLLNLIFKRRKLLSYLKNKNLNKYIIVIKKLKLRY